MEPQAHSVMMGKPVKPHQRIAHSWILFAGFLSGWATARGRSLCLNRKWEIHIAFPKETTTNCQFRNRIGSQQPFDYYPGDITAELSRYQNEVREDFNVAESIIVARVFDWEANHKSHSMT